MASQEQTFRSFTPSQSANYSQNRRDYHPTLYNTIITHHTSTGGQFNTILDVGTGPGTAVRTLAPLFTTAIGIDPSEGMISTARSLRGVTSSTLPIRFEDGTAEDLGADFSPPVEDGTVDLLTAATAAHWFDMPAFWGRAARVLKPGGTVALWTSGGMRVNPDTTPGGEGVQAAIRRLGERLEGYVVGGNRLSHELYNGLPLPWTVDPPVPGFEEGSLVRREWGTDGPGSEPGDRFYSAQPGVDLDTLEMALGTTSPVARWREANPEMVGTEGDLVRVMRREIEEVMRQAGVDQGKEMISGGVQGVLLMVKRKV
ncbi:S-adenosyl-L-methionine-dependent methyltransferase [Coniochaeta hoffmannii]|uniref:S-adenosyl-L-methionine-dependent methyltransferase n=1 Tax=Coniochaeta hoffmannii TaxID=91930 RepID=A0AA38VES3_9PEZI|nr:S-adenosyl-L-methionine-dependent methyltransferase [Coniochaeta hoffmannii]